MNLYATMMQKNLGDGVWSPWSPYRMMWGGTGKAGAWLWLVVTYHVVVALVFLLILVLVAVLLWKKIQLMNHEEKRRR